jgi:hypothetical protein
MQRIKLMIKVFLSEPLWFKMLISVTFLASIILSNSFFSNYPYLHSSSKLAAAILFCAYGIKFRRNFRLALIFFVCTAICIYLSLMTLF